MKVMCQMVNVMCQMVNAMCQMVNIMCQMVNVIASLGPVSRDVSAAFAAAPFRSEQRFTRVVLHITCCGLTTHVYIKCPKRFTSTLRHK